METEEASSNQTINDPLELGDGEEVPTSFAGHEELLPVSLLVLFLCVSLTYELQKKGVLCVSYIASCFRKKI